MTHKITVFLLIFSFSISVNAQNEFTITKKNRVIQESSTHSNKIPIGIHLPDTQFTTLNNETYQLGSLLPKGPVIFVFLATECPIAQRYAMRLKRMHSEFSPKHATIIGVYSNENDSIDDVKNYLKKAEYSFPIVKDSDGSLARYLGATMTPQAHLIDSTSILRYRGPIDDNRYVTRVKHHYLKDALDAIINGNPISIQETPAFGCTIHLPELTSQMPITFTKHIVPLLQKNCQSCHQQYGIAPFKLVGYKDVHIHADKIVELTQMRRMPPWRLGEEYGEFKNQHHLTDAEIEMIANWVKIGAPEGPTINVNPKTQSSEKWTFGEPDPLLEVPIVFKKVTKGKHASTNIRINTDFNKDLYLRGIDFNSVNSKIVRCVTVGIGSSAVPTDEISPESIQNFSQKQTSPNLTVGVRLGTWTSGFTTTVLHEGVGLLLSDDSHISLSVLYEGTGQEEQDTLQLGLYLSNSEETARLYKATLKNVGHVLNADPKPKKKETPYVFSDDVYVFSVLPSFSVDGQDNKVIAVTPAGDRIKMVWIKESNIDWLDEWLDIYHYKKPIYLPKGTRLEFVDQNNSDNRILTNPSYENTIQSNTYFYYSLASEYVPGENE